MNHDARTAPLHREADPDAELRQLESIADRHDVEHGGTSVCWRRFGQGRPLVLLHGGSGSWLHWARNIEHLAQRHTVWVPDMPGFHDSGLPRPAADGQPPLEPMLDALCATLDQLVGADTPVDLAGFSFGGLVAAHLAARRGAVRRLALLGAVGHGGARRPRGDMVEWKSLTDPAALAAALAHNLRMHMLHAADVDVDPLALEIHRLSCQGTRFRSKHISRAGGLQGAMDRIDAPVLMLWGQHDVTAFPEDAAHALAAGHPQREWCVVPGAGHWLQYERAADVNRLLASWFADEAV